MISIVVPTRKDQWQDIKRGDTTLLVMKDYPKQLKENHIIRIVVYLIAPHSTVVGEFELGRIIKSENGYKELMVNGGMTLNQLKEYGAGKELYGWEIKEPYEYKAVKKLADFEMVHIPSRWEYLYK